MDSLIKCQRQVLLELLNGASIKAYLRKYALERVAWASCGHLVVTLAGFEANINNCKSVVSSYKWRENVLLVAFCYVKFNRAARIIQRAFRRFRKAICTIQREWRNCMADPSRAMCRKRLVAEFAELGEVEPAI